MLKASVEAHTSGQGATEHMIWLRLPAAGNDGCLVGVCETKAAADEIARVFQRIIDCEKSWQRVIAPQGKPFRY